MNIKDYFKKSVWESFMNSQTMTEDVVLQIVIAMSAALILGLFIYKIYQIYFGGVVFSRSFATTLVGMTVLTCMLTLAISTNIPRYGGRTFHCPLPYRHKRSHGSFVPVLGDIGWYYRGSEHVCTGSVGLCPDGNFNPSALPQAEKRNDLHHGGTL